MEATVLRDKFAVRIDGIDLSTLEGDGLVEAKQLWMENKVAIFTGQDLDDEDLLAFTERLGPLFTHVQQNILGDGPDEVMYMSSMDKAAPVAGDLAWHSDQSYTPEPVFATILYGIIIPEEGGNTLFADLTATYESLPDYLRAKVDNVEACYSPVKKGRPRRRPMKDGQIKELSDIWHPLVRKHPYLNRKALYLSPNHITHIGDLSEEDSDTLLEELIIHTSKFVYSHRWTPGDVIMWDNTQVMHRRDSFPSKQPRFHKRTGFHLPEEMRTPVAD